MWIAPFERLAQPVLAAIRRRDVAVGASTILLATSESGADEEAWVALDHVALVFGQAVGARPQLDVALHVYFLRHPVVHAAG